MKGYCKNKVLPISFWQEKRFLRKAPESLSNLLKKKTEADSQEGATLLKLSACLARSVLLPTEPLCLHGHTKSPNLRFYNRTSWISLSTTTPTNIPSATIITDPRLLRAICFKWANFPNLSATRLSELLEYGLRSPKTPWAGDFYSYSCAKAHGSSSCSLFIRRLALWSELLPILT